MRRTRRRTSSGCSSRNASVCVRSFIAWRNHGRPNCGRVVETSYQVRSAPLSSIAEGPKLEEHDVLLLGVHNDEGTPDIECLLSQWRMLYYNKTCMEYGSSHKAQNSRSMMCSVSACTMTRACQTLNVSCHNGVCFIGIIKHTLSCC